jgi:hypothetical protein
MGIPPRRARGSIRFSLGIYNTAEEVDYLLQHLPDIVGQLRAISPLNHQHPDNDRFDPQAARRAHAHEAHHRDSDQAEDGVIL